jgi:hypothetical protein
MSSVMSHFNPYVTHLGIQAKQILAEENAGSVFGLVSGGAYLHFESGWVVFPRPVGTMGR